MIRSTIYFGLLAIALMAALLQVYTLGETNGKAICEVAQAKVNEKAEVGQKVATQAVINRATATGTRQEHARVAVNQFFNHLAKEQDHAPADPVDSCVLPAERLRLWLEANAGRTTEGAAPGQPDSAAPAAAAPGLRANTGLGIKPPGSGAGLPPAGPADVQPAVVSGDQP